MPIKFPGSTATSFFMISVSVASFEVRLIKAVCDKCSDRNIDKCTHRKEQVINSNLSGASNMTEGAILQGLRSNTVKLLCQLRLIKKEKLILAHNWHANWPWHP